LAVTRAEKTNQKHVFIYFRVKANYVYIENVFGFKDREERRKAWENALLMGKPSSNYVRVCGKHFKREEYICKLNSILSLNFEMIYLSITCRDQKTTFERK
jgi:hypothetical protein